MLAVASERFRHLEFMKDVPPARPPDDMMEILQILVRGGARLDELNSTSEAILIYAARVGTLNMQMIHLAEEQGMDVFATALGYDMLGTALLHGNTAVVEMLLPIFTEQYREASYWQEALWMLVKEMRPLHDHVTQRAIIEHVVPTFLTSEADLFFRSAVYEVLLDKEDGELRPVSVFGYLWADPGSCASDYVCLDNFDHHFSSLGHYDAVEALSEMIRISFGDLSGPSSRGRFSQPNEIDKYWRNALKFVDPPLAYDIRVQGAFVEAFEERYARQALVLVGSSYDFIPIVRVSQWFLDNGIHLSAVFTKHRTAMHFVVNDGIMPGLAEIWMAIDENRLGINLDLLTPLDYALMQAV